MRSRFADPLYRQRLVLRGIRSYAWETEEERWQAAIRYRAMQRGMSEQGLVRLRGWVEGVKATALQAARKDFLQLGIELRLSALLTEFQLLKSR